jgi:hypothetical protein
MHMMYQIGGKIWYNLLEQCIMYVPKLVPTDTRDSSYTISSSHCSNTRRGMVMVIKGRMITPSETDWIDN